jgi:hypothetical protein
MDQTKQKAWDDHIALDRAYCRWLRARAAIKNPDAEEGEYLRMWNEELEAGAALMSIAAPPNFSDLVCRKIEVFEALLGEELRDGLSTRSILMVALGSIKQDILNRNGLD